MDLNMKSVDKIEYMKETEDAIVISSPEHTFYNYYSGPR